MVYVDTNSQTALSINYNENTKTPQGYLYDIWKYMAKKLNYEVKRKSCIWKKTRWDYIQ